MTWLRSSDTAAHDPRTLAPLDRDDADERTVDEVFGFSSRLACEAGSKETDGHVTRAMVRALAGSPARASRLMGMLEEAGVWVPTGQGWRLVNDPGYLHLRPQDEVDRDRVRGRDQRNDALTVPARLRDGDACRYCRKSVDWNDRRSLKGGTYEHVNIANQPTQLHEYVVCCFECNREPASRGELNPPPEQPVYGAATRDFIRKRLGKWPTKAEIAERLEVQRTSAEHATGRQRTEKEIAPQGKRTSSAPATTGLRTTEEIAASDARQRPEDASGSAAGVTPPGSRDRPPEADLLDRGITDPDSSGRVGTSSSGSSHAGTGGDGPASGTTPPPASRRSKRGRRAKPSGEEQS